MNPIARNVLAVIAGFVVGSLVNMGLVKLGMSVIPPPAGADVSTTLGLRESIKFFTPVNFLFPFLAHALGTLVGSFVTAKLVTGQRMKFAMLIGVAFLLGGLAMVTMVGGPPWFIAADLLLAYIPMAYLGGRLAGAKGIQTA